MTEDLSEYDEPGHLPYCRLEEIDFGIITLGIKQLPFFKDDVYLGMQAMNAGMVDSFITQQEYLLLRSHIDQEKTPVEQALAVSALTQMLIFALYEVIRMWRDRMYEFDKLYKNGGIVQKLRSMETHDLSNVTARIRKNQLNLYNDESSYRDEIELAWKKLEPIYRMLELFRINLAKHAAPGKDNLVPRTPGYGRINQWCGSLDYELIDKDGSYVTLNRRQLAEALRAIFDHEVK